MSDLALLTPGTGPGGRDGAVAHVLPALELLPHQVTVHGLDPAALVHADPHAVIVDGTTQLVQARSTARTLHAMRVDAPVLVVLTEGGVGVLDEGWGVVDFLLPTAGPAEIEARLRLATQARRATAPDTATDSSGPIRVADVVVDEGSWTVRAGGRPLDLTYKEFELLKFLIQHPGRVVTRETLLQEVWGIDYYGGTRTVDVHVRRLRAKLGSERESLIGTIRNVGYRFAGPRGGSGEASGRVDGGVNTTGAEGVSAPVVAAPEAVIGTDTATAGAGRTATAVGLRDGMSQ